MIRSRSTRKIIYNKYTHIRECFVSEIDLVELLYSKRESEKKEKPTNMVMVAEDRWIAAESCETVAKNFIIRGPCN